MSNDPLTPKSKLNQRIARNASTRRRACNALRLLLIGATVEIEQEWPPQTHRTPDEDDAFNGVIINMVEDFVKTAREGKA